MKRNYFFLWLFIILFSSCKKEIHYNTEVKLINSQYKDFYFKEGSYWVYQEETSKDFDSVSLYNVDSGFYWNPPPVHSGPGIAREYYQMKLVSVPRYIYYFDLIDSYGIRRNPETEWFICGRIFYSLDTLPNFEYIDSLKINETTFYNVIKCKIKANDYLEGCSNCGFSFDTDLFTAPKFGIIRKVIYKETNIETWNLIKWKFI